MLIKHSLVLSTMPMVGWPLDFLHNSIKSLRDEARKANRNPDEIKVLTLTFPQIIMSEGKKDTNNNSKGGGKSQHLPLTGTIEEIGRDIQRIKEMGVDHIMFAVIGLGLDKVVDITKQLSKFAR
jgi:hypothetical protein